MSDKNISAKSTENSLGMKKKPKRSKAQETVIDVLYWLAGCFLYAVALNLFLAPNHIAQGGATGAATLLNFLFNKISIGQFSIIINIPLFVAAWKFLGLKFLFRSGIVTMMLSVVIDLVGLFMPKYDGNLILAAVFGGALSGAGLSLIFLRGATSGGTDVLARLLRLKWPHISMGRVILMADMCVVLSAGLVYGNLESVLYAAVVVFVSSRVIDYIMYGTGNGKLLMVITLHAHEIAAEVTKQMHRGVTILPVQGGYTGEDKNMIICAVRSSEVARLSRIIRSIDEAPFIIVSEAGEILGEGFKAGSDY